MFSIQRLPPIVRYVLVSVEDRDTRKQNDNIENYQNTESKKKGKGRTRDKKKTSRIRR